MKIHLKRTIGRTLSASGIVAAGALPLVFGPPLPAQTPTAQTRVAQAQTQTPSPHPHVGESRAKRDARMAWWREARFGMFTCSSAS
jgi:hypothetical protein